jgi:hypothetical protein
MRSDVVVELATGMNQPAVTGDTLDFLPPQPPSGRQLSVTIYRL